MKNVDRLVDVFTDEDFIRNNWGKQPKFWESELKGCFLKPAKLKSFPKILNQHVNRLPASLHYFDQGKFTSFDNSTPRSKEEIFRWAIESIVKHPIIILMISLTNAFYGQLCWNMGYRFSSMTPCVGYFSVGATKGARKHKDRSHAFVFQHKGKSRWKIHDRSGKKLVLDVILKPGSVLYMPIGFYHEVERLSKQNTHVTVGVRYHSPRHEMLEFVRSPAFLPAVPTEWRNLSGEKLLEFLETFSDETPPDDLE